MSRHKRMIERDDGWCDWVQPIMDGYRMSCCDCGLVHDMQFKVLRKGKDLPNGAWEAKPLDGEKYRVEFRARRNKRSTSAMRRNASATADSAKRVNPKSPQEAP
jgi:nitrate/TMAO reductase-like tetraheme cytochrome c subunit